MRGSLAVIAIVLFVVIAAHVRREQAQCIEDFKAVAGPTDSYAGCETSPAVSAAAAQDDDEIFEPVKDDAVPSSLSAIDPTPQFH